MAKIDYDRVLKYTKVKTEEEEVKENVLQTEEETNPQEPKALLNWNQEKIIEFGKLPQTKTYFTILVIVTIIGFVSQLIALLLAVKQSEASVIDGLASAIEMVLSVLIVYGFWRYISAANKANIIKMRNGLSTIQMYYQINLALLMVLMVIVAVLAVVFLLTNFWLILMAFLIVGVIYLYYRFYKEAVEFFGGLKANVVRLTTRMPQADELQKRLGYVVVLIILSLISTVVVVVLYSIGLSLGETLWVYLMQFINGIITSISFIYFYKLLDKYYSVLKSKLKETPKELLVGQYLGVTSKTKVR